MKIPILENFNFWQLLLGMMLLRFIYLFTWCFLTYYLLSTIKDVLILFLSLLLFYFVLVAYLDFHRSIIKSFRYWIYVKYGRGKKLGRNQRPIF
jgi:hypothetical protein